MKLFDIYNRMANEYGAKTGEMVYTFSDKGAMHSYIDYYEKHFEPKRDNVRLLEIGVMTGGSLLMWQEFFTNYKLVGLDLNTSWNQPRPFQPQLKSDPNIKVFFGVDSIRGPVPNEVAEQRFDFIIDDGDHSLGGQLGTLKNYWSLLDHGGVYFVEDVIGESEAAAIIEYARANLKDAVRFEHYKGYKLGRKDDQIVAFVKGLRIE